MIHSIMKSKATLVPEVPRGITNMELLKPLCEQQGVKIATRTHCQDPKRAQPGFQILMFSNHPMDIGPNPDGGQARRVSSMGLTRVFEEGSNEDRPELKMEINAGRYNLQMFHTVKRLYPSLDLYSTNIRRPYDVEMDTQEVISENIDDADPKAWIHNLFEGCLMIAQASKESDVKQAVAQQLGIAKVRQVKNVMIELGFQVDCNDGKGHRYVRYDIDGDGIKKPIKLKA